MLENRDPIEYRYDALGKLTQIEQGVRRVSIKYDDAGRRAHLELPNGVVQVFGYDEADQLRRIDFRRGDQPLGDLSYAYDEGGRRTAMGGSLAATELPVPHQGAQHNAFNQLVGQGNAKYLYDENGNLLTDDRNTYTWDERNRLIAVAGATQARFTYDALGRRAEKQANGVVTSYLYDGFNFIRETTGTNRSYLITGLSVDEVYARTAGDAEEVMLTDALGSVIALADSDGEMRTRYLYGPYGEPVVMGRTSTNAQQFTGRESDETGLMYYRARYYHPRLARFISEDPIGLSGGINAYAYAQGNPVSFIDPYGLDVTVNRYAGALGFGHVGVGVGSPVTEGFYPADSASGAAIVAGMDVPGVVKSDIEKGTPKESVTIPTSPSGDRAARDFVDSLRRSPGNYNLFRRNCTKTVIEALRRAGIDCPEVIKPSAVMRDLNRGQCVDTSK